MKIIWPDNITAVAASSEASNYEAEMVLNQWPGAVWKANATTSQTLTITTTAPDAIHLGYTNFNGTLAYTTKNSGGGTVASGNLTANGSIGAYHYWYEPPSPETITSVVFTFPAVTTAAQVGIVRAGTLVEISNPKYGMVDGIEDYSIETELNNGGIYSLDRSVARVISGEILTTRNSNGTDPLVSLAASIKSQAFSVMLIDDPEEILLARFDGRPEASRDYPLYNMVSFALREAI